MDRDELDVELLSICERLQVISELAIERGSRVIRDHAQGLEKHVESLANRVYQSKNWKTT